MHKPSSRTYSPSYAVTIPCLKLEDPYFGNQKPVQHSMSYTWTVTNTSGTHKVRFTGAHQTPQPIGRLVHSQY